MKEHYLQKIEKASLLQNFIENLFKKEIELKKRKYCCNRKFTKGTGNGIYGQTIRRDIEYEQI